MKGGKTKLLVVGISRALRLGAAHDHIASHEGLIMQDFNSTLGFINGRHLDKPIALGFMGVVIVDDLDAAH